MTLTCDALLANHAAAWHRATVHPFLTGCKQGTILPAQFNTWLVQDYLFVKDFTRMVGHILGSAPDHHLDLLLGGLGASKTSYCGFRPRLPSDSSILKPPAKQPVSNTVRLWPG